MENILLVTITTIIIAVIIVVTTLLIIKKIKSDKYKKEVERLDIERNQIVGIPILSEISKVRDLVKTDNLKEKLNEWDTTFKLIKDDRVPKISDLLAEADFLINKKEYKTALKKIANVEMEIEELKSKSNNLLDEIKIITTSEERNRSLITKLKVMYRELQSKFERTRKDYDEIGDSIELQFENIDKRFSEFENAMDHNDYVLVEKIVINIEDLINDMKVILDDVPTIVLMATILIPKKIEDISIYYSRMIRDGYPLDYLNVEYNIKEINNKVNVIMDNAKMLNTKDAILELKTITDYLDELFKDFDQEKECKNIFHENSKIFKKRLDKVNKMIYNIYLSLDDIKLTYDLKDEEISKFNLINEKLENLNKDFKTLIEHSKGKTFAYSKLADELSGLSNKLTRLNDDLEYQLHSISSMQDDEYRAKEQLQSIEKLLKQTKMRLKDFKFPFIPDSYFVELKEAGAAIREIIRELDKKPIVIKILNIRVDTARDLVFKIYNKTNELIKNASMAEKIIVYGNRYRSSYSDVDVSLDKAENLFRKGLYKESYNISLEALGKIDESIKSKFTI
ncbi:MAG: septation ring formation regulator EzrA [Bacilli bacterium]